MKITQVLISESCVKSLKKRGLVDQWHKAKGFILEGQLDKVDFRKRRPYKSEKYYFKLNKQYRAFCFFDEEDTIKVFEINDHQK